MLHTKIIPEKLELKNPYHVGLFRFNSMLGVIMEKVTCGELAEPELCLSGKMMQLFIFRIFRVWLNTHNLPHPATHYFFINGFSISKTILGV